MRLELPVNHREKIGKGARAGAAVSTVADLRWCGLAGRVGGQHVLDGRNQILHADRLGYVVVHAGLEAPLPVPVQGVGGHGDYGKVLACPGLELADGAGGL